MTIKVSQSNKEKSFKDLKNKTSLYQSDSLRMPPHNIEAEDSVLGSLMLDKEAIIKVIDIIRPEDFYNDHKTQHWKL